MKKKKQWQVFFWLSLFLIMFLVDAKTVFSTSDISIEEPAVLAAKEKKPKVISIILDDSNSMVQEDKEGRPYTSRWVQADYALKALAAMMNKGDTLRLYVMGDYRDESQGQEGANWLWRIGEDGTSAELLSSLHQEMDEIEYSGYTYFPAVEKAAADMQEDIDRNECWIVILADGVFWEEGGKIEDPELKDRLEKVNEIYNDHAEDKKINLGYIPIEQQNLSEEYDNAGFIIFGSDGNQENNVILKQMTAAINKIYGRMQAEEDAERKYIKYADGKITFQPDIPVSRLFVFAQSSGSSETKKERSSKNYTLDLSVEIPGGGVSASDAVVKFQGREKTPQIRQGDQSSTPPFKEDQIKYQDLKGAVYTYNENGNLESITVEAQINNTELENVSADANLEVELYYQPDVKIGVIFEQDGKAAVPVTDGDEKREKIPNCLSAGPVSVRFQFLNQDGSPIEAQNSPLLQQEKFEIYLEDADTKKRRQMKKAEDGIFKKTLEEKKYRLIVQSPWGEQSSEVFDVQEALVPLEIDAGCTGPLNLDRPDGVESLIRVTVTEQGDIPSSWILDSMEVACRCEDERVSTEFVSRNSNQWVFRAGAVNPEDHRSFEKTGFQVTVSRPYAYRESAEASCSFDTEITSDLLGVSADYQSEEGIHVYWPWNRSAKLQYRCGTILTKKQAQNVVIEELQVEPEYMEAWLSEGKNGSFRFKNRFFWQGTPEKTDLKVSFLASYDRMNQINTGEIELIIPVNWKVPWIQYVILGVMAAAVFILAAWLIRLAAGCYIPKLNPVLRNGQTRTDYELKEGRIRYTLMPWTPLVISYKGDKFIQPFVLKVRKIPHEDRYRLCRGSMIPGALQAKAGSRPVDLRNAAEFDGKKRKFSILDNKQIRFELEV